MVSAEIFSIAFNFILMFSDNIAQINLTNTSRKCVCWLLLEIVVMQILNTYDQSFVKVIWSRWKQHMNKLQLMQKNSRLLKVFIFLWTAFSGFHVMSTGENKIFNEWKSFHLKIGFAASLRTWRPWKSFIFRFTVDQ